MPPLRPARTRLVRDASRLISMLRIKPCEVPCPVDSLQGLIVHSCRLPKGKDERQTRRPPRLPSLHGAANPGHPRPPTWLGHRPPHRADQRRRAGAETGNLVPCPPPPATDGMDYFKMGRVR